MDPQTVTGKREKAPDADGSPRCITSYSGDLGQSRHVLRTLPCLEIKEGDRFQVGPQCLAVPFPPSTGQARGQRGPACAHFAEPCPPSLSLNRTCTRRPRGPPWQDSWEMT